MIFFILLNNYVIRLDMHAQSCLTVCDPMDCSPPGSFVHGILRVRILKWVAVPSSRGSYQPRNRTHISYVSCISRFFPAIMCKSCTDVRVGLERRMSTEELMLSNCGVGEDTLGLQGDQISQS